MKFKAPIMSVRDLNFRVGSQQILSNISLDILSSDYVAIIGPNGGGKTTLIRMLMNLDKPTSGDIKLFGKKIKDFKEWHKIGYVPQRATQVDINFPATVLDIVRMGLVSKRKLFSKESVADKAAIEDAMAKMGVTHLRDKMVGTLSGGQRQRVMIARALASNPDVLILDEPNTGVDVKSQQSFYALLSRLNKEEGKTIVFITHDIGVIADDIARLFTVNQKILTCNNPKEAMSCEDMSQLYGIEAHLIHNHSHQHEH